MTDYREIFAISKTKAEDWKINFTKVNQRKPTTEDIDNAPEQIKTCFRNCQKIKNYYEKKTKGDQKRKDEKEVENIKQKEIEKPNYDYVVFSPTDYVLASNVTLIQNKWETNFFRKPKYWKTVVNDDLNQRDDSFSQLSESDDESTPENETNLNVDEHELLTIKIVKRKLMF
jgi:hypothetical protein